MARFGVAVAVLTVFLVRMESQEWMAGASIPVKHEFVGGLSDFMSMVSRKLLIVDKTLFIKQIMTSDWQTEVIARPRRFGKSTILSTLQEFLSIDFYRKDIDIFEGFLINTDVNFCEQHKNKHPVIFLNFNCLSAETFARFLEKFREMVQELFSEFELVLMKSCELHDLHKKFINDVIHGPSANINVLFTIPRLMKFLKMHYKKNVVVLIDEYDTPVIVAFKNDFYRTLIEEFRGIMTKIFKDSRTLWKGVIFGVTLIAKESIFSALNNVMTYSVASEEYDDCCGFLEREVEWFATKLGLNSPNLLKKMKEHYDGYTIGNKTLYNPWSASLCLNKGGAVNDWWVGTGDTREFEKLFISFGVLPIIKAEVLIHGWTINQLFKPNLVYRDIKNDEDYFWTLVVQAGYLTFQQKHRQDYDINATLRIPNNEVKNAFKAMTKRSRSQLNVPYFKEFVKSIQSKNEKKAQIILSEFLVKAADVFKGQDRIYTTAEIMKCLQIIFGPIVDVLVGSNYTLLAMKNTKNGEHTLILINSIEKEEYLKEPKMNMKEWFQPLWTGTASALGAELIKYVLITFYQNHPHFFIF